jgi:pimeloyl-ACP methyl ester carboxylesterase
VKVRANGIDIEIERIGEGGEPLVLVMGIGAQLVLWPDDFCEYLASRGFDVIRMDNRDVGRSTHLSHLPVPDPRMTLARAAFGLPIAAPYTLLDMARDVTGVLDALGLEKAHVVGASMGGMIVQTLAIAQPERVLSLTSIMSTTGDRRYMLGSQPNAFAALLGAVPRTREEAGERMVRTFTAIGSRTYPVDVDYARDLGARAFDRGSNPAGFARQMAAICAAGSRRAALQKLRVPTLVVHGSQDPLLHVAAGRATARLVPNAHLLELGDMGHDLPKPLRRTIADAIRSLADGVKARGASSSTA